MPVSIAALIARTQEAIDQEQDLKKLRVLQANLAAFLATKAEMDDDDGDGDDAPDSEDESKAKKAAAKAEKAKKAAAAAAHRAKAAEWKKKAEEAEEAAKKAEADEEEESESESEEAKALVAAGGSGAGNALLERLAASVKQLEETHVASSKAALISGARKLGAITKAEGTWLERQPLPSVESFLEMRTRGGLIVTSAEDLVRPRQGKPGTEESLPAETVAMIESAVQVWQGDRKSYREALVKAHLEAHTKQLAAAGDSAGRY